MNGDDKIKIDPEAIDDETKQAINEQWKREFDAVVFVYRNAFPKLAGTDKEIILAGNRLYCELTGCNINRPLSHPQEWQVAYCVARQTDGLTFKEAYEEFASAPVEAARDAILKWLIARRA